MHFGHLADLHNIIFTNFGHLADFCGYSKSCKISPFLAIFDVAFRAFARFATHNLYNFRALARFLYY